MQVSEATKNAFKSDTATKHLRIRFIDLGFEVPEQNIYEESLVLKESVSDSENLDFVGCISSMFQIKIHNLNADVKGRRIGVWIKADNTEEIKLFDGIVDNVKLDSGKMYKEITAYDALYSKGNIDVAPIYKNMYFPCTLRTVRNTLFAHLGIDEPFVDLPNDEIEITKRYDPTTLKALDVIKAICQINGVWGRMNRENQFEYIFTPDIEPSCVPIQVPFQLADPNAGIFAFSEKIAYYRSLFYQEYKVNLVDKLTIRQNDEDEGVTVGEGENEYIIQGNMWTDGLDAETLETMATNIYPRIRGVMYHPYTCTCNGLPFLEVGKDAISCKVLDINTQELKEVDFYLLSRTMKGIQALKDSFEAKGEEDRSIFISDLNQKIDQIKQATDKIVKDINSGKIGGFKFVEVQDASEIPSPPEPNTGYYKVGEVSYFDRVVI